MNHIKNSVYKVAAMLAMSGIALTPAGVNAANLSGASNFGEVYEFNVKYVDNHAKKPDSAGHGASGLAMATGVLAGAVVGKSLIGSTLGAFAGAAAGGLATDKIASATEDTKGGTSQLIVVQAHNTPQTLAMTSSDAACDKDDAACLSIKGCEAGDRALVMFTPNVSPQVIACYDAHGKMKTYIEKHREQPIQKTNANQNSQTDNQSDHIGFGME